MRRILIAALLTFVLLLSVSMINVYAHPGGTDGSGGHYNRSTGEYHYHHGRSAHSHYDMDGDGDDDCPYDFRDNTSSAGASIEGEYKVGNYAAHENESPSYLPKLVIIAAFAYLAYGYYKRGEKIKELTGIVESRRTNTYKEYKRREDALLRLVKLNQDRINVLRKKEAEMDKRSTELYEKEINLYRWSRVLQQQEDDT